MKFLLSLLIGLLGLFSPCAHAQLDPVSSVSTAQSGGTQEWFEINTPYLRLIYPQKRQREAQEIASLINYYAPYVGKNMGIEKPRKFPMVLRPGMPLPNGFVTLSPRRSEWFLHETYIPFIGGLNFYDALSIHEYRHINQYDYFKQRTNKILYWLFGEAGQSLTNAIGLPNWYYEGDAVWSETHYTQGGRGRSPRFSARLKALILSGMTPTYDELVGRSYKTSLPDHYVFGYFLVARAYKLYGKDFWPKVLTKTSGFALSPYRLYSAFEDISGKNFDAYVRESFSSLKKEWEREGDHLPQTKSKKYKRYLYPMVDRGKIFYLKKDLNSYWALHTRKKKIKELPLSPDYSKVDLKRGRLAYTQLLPDLRYSYQGYSDLFVYNIGKDSLKRWSRKKRIYHPMWSPKGKKIAFVEKGDGGKWSLGLLKSPRGAIKRLYFKEDTPLEFAWKNSKALYVLLQNKEGEKLISLVHLHPQKEYITSQEVLVPPTRNNLYNLRAMDEELFFEGDWKGRVQIIRFNPKNKNKKYSLCTKEVIAAYMPFPYRTKKGTRLLHSFEMAHGQRIKRNKLKTCQNIQERELLGPAHLANKSTDSLSGNAGLSLTSKVFRSDFKRKEYADFFGGLSPHSWSLFGTNGFGLSLSGNNYLGTVGYNYALGYNSSESKPYTNLSLSYSKYYPIFSLLGSYRQRNAQAVSHLPKIKWNETEYGLRITLPFQWSSGFSSSGLALTLDSGQIIMSSKDYSYSYDINGETLTYSSGGLSYSSFKKKTFRQIYSPWGISLRGFYRDANSNSRKSFASSLIHLRGSLYFPSFFKNQGFKLSALHEEQTKGKFNYRHDPLKVNPLEFPLGRGYDYTYVDSYSKFSFDYALPLSTPDLTIGDWAYIKRIYAIPFYDFTSYRFLKRKGTLESYGAELYFETTFFRRFPMTWGFRYTQKKTTGESDLGLIFSLSS